MVIYCPVHAIEMKENKPFWALSKCDNCLRCLHRCPVEAINYGDSTRNRSRYTYESSLDGFDLEARLTGGKNKKEGY